MTALQELHPVADAARAVERLAEVSWSALEPDELLEVAGQLARARAQIDGALLAVAEQVQATDAAADAGWANTQDFLTHVTGGRKGAGATMVRVIKQTADLPAVRRAMAAGDLSLAQASVIGSRTSTLPGELWEQAADRMVELATLEGHDATDLDRGFPSLVRDELDPDGRMRATEAELPQLERAAHHARFLSLTNDALGGVRIRGYSTPEDAELIRTTLMPLTAPVVTEPGACGGRSGHGQLDDEGRPVGRSCPDPACGHDGRDPRDHGARMFDALVETCRRMQAADELPRAHGTAARITVTLPFDQLRDEVAGHGLMESGDSLSAAAVRRLACDAEILPAVLGSDSQVLDVGRLHRLVTTPIWLALVLRDRHCAFPGCSRPPIACDAHHVKHWTDGGLTELDNLVLLCRRHHTITHQTPWQVQIDPESHRPVWTQPPRLDSRHRFTYLPARRPPPRVA